MAIPSGTLQWQAIEETYDGKHEPPNSYRGYTYRAWVPGGWLVAIWAGDSDADHAWGGGLTFVPDPERKWDVPERKFKSSKPA
jgi:hypothetical protein